MYLGHAFTKDPGLAYRDACIVVLDEPAPADGIVVACRLRLGDMLPPCTDTRIFSRMGSGDPKGSREVGKAVADRLFSSPRSFTVFACSRLRGADGTGDVFRIEKRQSILLEPNTLHLQEVSCRFAISVGWYLGIANPVCGVYLSMDHGVKATQNVWRISVQEDGVAVPLPEQGEILSGQSSAAPPIVTTSVAPVAEWYRRRDVCLEFVFHPVPLYTSIYSAPPSAFKPAMPVGYQLQQFASPSVKLEQHTASEESAHSTISIERGLGTMSVHDQGSWDVFISFRFGESLSLAMALKQALVQRSVRVFLCNVDPGQSIFDHVLHGLSHCKLVVILGSKTYGQRTQSLCSTYEELLFICNRQHGKPFFLLKLCEHFEEPAARMLLHNDVAYMKWQADTQPSTQLIDAIIAKLSVEKESAP